MLVYHFVNTMVPQQNLDDRSDSPTSSGLPVFGSQLVDKDSSTPYSDATQVGIFEFLFHPQTHRDLSALKKSAIKKYVSEFSENYSKILKSPENLEKSQSPALDTCGCCSVTFPHCEREMVIFAKFITKLTVNLGAKISKCKYFCRFAN